MESRLAVTGDKWQVEREKQELLLSEYRFSVLDDQKVMKMGNDNGCMTM